VFHTKKLVKYVCFTFQEKDYKIVKEYICKVNILICYMLIIEIKVHAKIELLIEKKGMKKKEKKCVVRPSTRRI
jgi:hypothetical protein